MTLRHESQQTFVDSVNNYMQDPEFKGDELLEAIIQDFQPFLFCDEKLARNTALMRKLSNFLKSWEINIISQPSNFINAILATTTYSGEFQGKALHLVQHMFDSPMLDSPIPPRDNSFPIIPPSPTRDLIDQLQYANPPQPLILMRKTTKRYTSPPSDSRRKRRNFLEL